METKLGNLQAEFEKFLLIFGFRFSQDASMYRALMELLVTSEHFLNYLKYTILLFQQHTST